MLRPWSASWEGHERIRNVEDRFTHCHILKGVGRKIRGDLAIPASVVSEADLVLTDSSDLCLPKGKWTVTSPSPTRLQLPLKGWCLGLNLPGKLLASRLPETEGSPLFSPVSLGNQEPPCHELTHGTETLARVNRHLGQTSVIRIKSLNYRC